MAPRLDLSKVSPDAYRALFGLEQFVRQSGLEPSLIHLVKLRASYMNGCAYCVDMHSKDARVDGETEQRIYSVPVWRETGFYTDRERAALAWTESVTALGHGGVPDDVYAEVAAHFDQREMVALTIGVVAINAWNRVAVPFRIEPGSYPPRAGAAAAAVSAA